MKKSLVLFFVILLAIVTALPAYAGGGYRDRIDYGRGGNYRHHYYNGGDYAAEVIGAAAGAVAGAVVGAVLGGPPVVVYYVPAPPPPVCHQVCYPVGYRIERCEVYCR